MDLREYSWILVCWLLCTLTRMEISLNVFFETWMWIRSKKCLPRHNQVQQRLQERELSDFYNQLEWTDSQLDVLCFAARQHLETIARKGVRLRGFCSVS